MCQNYADKKRHNSWKRRSDKKPKTDKKVRFDARKDAINLDMGSRGSDPEPDSMVTTEPLSALSTDEEISKTLANAFSKTAYYQLPADFESTERLEETSKSKWIIAKHKLPLLMSEGDNSQSLPLHLVVRAATNVINRKTKSATSNDENDGDDNNNNNSNSQSK